MPSSSPSGACFQRNSRRMPLSARMFASGEDFPGRGGECPGWALEDAKPVGNRRSVVAASPRRDHWPGGLILLAKASMTCSMVWCFPAATSAARSLKALVIGLYIAIMAII